MVIRLVIDYEELVKVALKKGGWKKEWVGELRVNGGYWILWPLCVFGYISGVCVRDCRVLGLCAVGRVG
jgi:hypothetical protein